LASEIELKLELTCDQADRLEASGFPRGHALAAELVSTYFDTPELTLHRNGLCLRIRDEEAKSVQCAKASAGSPAGLFRRGEWELPVPGHHPVADTLSPVPALLEGEFAALAPLFTVHVARKTWRMRHAGATVALSLDRGEVLAGPQRKPFCEVELELLDGPTTALFDLARKVEMLSGAQIGTLSKAERGYRLLDRGVTATRADNILLDEAMDLPAAFAAIIENCMRQYLLNEQLLVDAPTAEAVHQARVALRRMRSAISLFKAELAGDASAELRERIGALAAVLGKARDLDMLLDHATPGCIHSRLQQARDLAYRDVQQEIAAGRTRRLMLDLVEWLAGLAGTGRHGLSISQFAADLLDQLRRKLRRNGRHLAELTDEQRHRLRKDAKKLRYAAEFFASLFPGHKQKRQRKKFNAALQIVQDNLGALNDRTVARARLAALGLAEGPDYEHFFASWDRCALVEHSVDARHELLDVGKFWK